MQSNQASLPMDPTGASLYECEFRVWSNYGVTPITKREGAYCDLLVHRKAMVSGPEEAKIMLQALIKSTRYGYSGHFSIPDYPNQNIRNRFLHATD